MATHTGVDLYKCAFCSATFKSKSNRINHCKRHHPLEYNTSIKQEPITQSINIELVTENVDEDDEGGLVIYEFEEIDTEDII